MKKNNPEPLKKEIEIFERMCRTNDALIENPKINSLLPMGAIITSEGNLELFGLMFRNYEEKIRIKKSLFDKILSQKIKGYIVLLDAKMTKMDLEGKKCEVVDCMVRGLYTPQKTIKRFCFYKNHKILHEENKKFQEKTEKMNMPSTDEWDLFNSSHFDDDDPELKKLNEIYQKFKKENPEKFKEVCK